MNDQTQAKPMPIESHRDGRVTAAIWENEGEHGPMYNATLSYSYQDKDGNWRDTASIPGHELLKAGRLMEMAYASVHRLKEQDRARSTQEQQSPAQQSQSRSRGRGH